MVLQIVDGGLRSLTPTQVHHNPVCGHTYEFITVPANRASGVRCDHLFQFLHRVVHTPNITTPKFVVKSLEHPPSDHMS